MGRHGVVRPRSRSVLAAAVVAAAVAGLSVGVVRAAGGGGEASAGPACTGDPVRLRIGADATVTPWLSDLVSSYTSVHRTVDGRCVAPVVTTVPPGLWEFSARLAGAADHRALVPLGPVGQRVGRFPDRRAAAVGAYRGLRARTGTGLYDTVLAAYRDAVAHYRPDAVNTVVVISDGIDEDPGSIGLDALLRQLRGRYDARRPVHVVTLAYGRAADPRVLARIAGVTRGLAFTAVDPRRVSDVFIAAVTAYRVRR